MYLLKTTVAFDAAHQLSQMPEGHPCSRVHGHRWTVVVTVKREHLNLNSFVMDLHDLKALCDSTFVALLDHRMVNHQVHFTPTCENLAKWIYGKVAYGLPSAASMHSVEVIETPGNSATYLEE